VNPAFWKGRRVLLTGHTGFKGSWLSLWLQRLGAEVTGFALPAPSDPSLFALARVDEGLRASITGDVRDLEAVRAAVREARPEVVLHLAARAIVRESLVDPVGTYATNVMGTVNVLEAARESADVRSVVVVTSDKCYENREWVWGYREHEAMGGKDPYSSSKGCAELVTHAYRSTFFADPDGPRVASARAGNVIGGGDWGADRLVPDLMRAAVAGHAVQVRNPDAIRPWQHVLNSLTGYLLLAERLWDDPAFAEGWNFGPADEDARPVRWIADRICERWGRGLRWETDALPQPREAHFLKLDSAKARTELGWRPRWDLGQALDRIVTWYSGYGDGADLRELTLAQIADFESA
jgi:CDP-glucose 4,6-dehydratase